MIYNLKAFYHDPGYSIVQTFGQFANKDYSNIGDNRFTFINFIIFVEFEVIISWFDLLLVEEGKIRVAF